MAMSLKAALAEFCKPFAGPPGDHFDIGEPFVRDGYVYATDGRSIIRAKSKGPSTTGRRIPTNIAALYPSKIQGYTVSWKKRRDVSAKSVCIFGVTISAEMYDRIKKLGKVLCYRHPANSDCLVFTAPHGIEGMVMRVDVDNDNTPPAKPRNGAPEVVRLRRLCKTAAVLIERLGPQDKYLSFRSRLLLAAEGKLAQ